MKKFSHSLTVIASSLLFAVILFFVLRFILVFIYGGVYIIDGLSKERKEKAKEQAVIKELSQSDIIYANQNIDQVNFNNITVNSDFPLLTGDSAYYYKFGGGKYYFYRLSDSGEELLFSHGSCGKIQRFNDCLYFADNDSLVEYNCVYGEKRTVCGFDGYTIDKCVVSDGIAYVKLVHEGGNSHIESVNLESGSTIRVADNTHSIGVSNGSLVNLVKKGDLLSLYKYDSINNMSEHVADFEIQLEDNELFKPSVCFTDEFVFLIADADNYSKIIISDLKGTVKCVKKVSRIYTYTAFQDSLFFDAISDDSQTYIYSVSASSGDITEIARFTGFVDMSSYSNDSVYVTSGDFDGVRKYYANGSYENVFIKK